MNENDFLLNKPLKLSSYGKINLFLDVIKRRQDGYHEISTLFHTIELADNICFYLSKNEHSADYVSRLFKVNMKKPVSGAVPLSSDNIRLVMIADDDNEKCFTVPCDNQNTVAVAMKKLFSSIPFAKPSENLNFYILFQKNVPAGAGLAGGSSNAACALRAANFLMKLGLADDQLRAIGARAGADLSFMLEGGCAHCEGVGEKFVSSYDIPVYPLIIVYPNFEVSSRDAYANVVHHTRQDLANLTEAAELKARESAIKRVNSLVEAMTYGKLNDIPKFLYNKLEDPVFARKHQIRELRETLVQMGYRATLMSGSGSSVYTILDPGESQEALDAHLERVRTEMHKRFSKTYKVALTRTRKAIGWEKMLL